MTAKTGVKEKMAKKDAEASGLGLDALGDLSGLLTPAAPGAGSGPLLLAIGSIEEDPDQPRGEDNPGFSEESLKELAATIKQRGVKSPISVREKEGEPGRYLINHGARRFRASNIAGLSEIPAFIDNDYNRSDQVVENLQRNELTAREIADYIGRELAGGAKKGDIAKQIGKSAAFVTQHVALLDLPEPIAVVFNSGRVNDVTVVNELCTAYKTNPDAVADWLADDNQEITRGSIKLFREFLDEKEETRDPNTIDTFSGKTDAEAGGDADPEKPKEKKLDDPDKIKKAIVQVEHNGRLARLLLTKRPPADGWAWLKYEDDGQEVETELVSVQLKTIMDGV